MGRSGTTKIFRPTKWFWSVTFSKVKATVTLVCSQSFKYDRNLGISAIWVPLMYYHYKKKMESICICAMHISHFCHLRPANGLYVTSQSHREDCPTSRRLGQYIQFVRQNNTQVVAFGLVYFSLFWIRNWVLTQFSKKACDLTRVVTYGISPHQVVEGENTKASGIIP